MSSIPTAEEFLLQDPGIKIYNLKEDHPDLFRFIQENMIGFTQIYVQAALKAASEEAICHHVSTWNCVPRGLQPEVNKESILNAYPLTNIK